MLIPVVATQLLLQEASESTLHIRNQAPSRLLNRFKEILTNIALLCGAQEWCGTYHLLNNYSRQLTSQQVIQLEETRANLTERFAEEYKIQQQRFTILRQLGIGHVLLFREINYVYNTPLYLAFVARETLYDLHNDLRSLALYFFHQLSDEHGALRQEMTSELFGQFHSDELRLELVRNLWQQEVSDARDQQWRS